DGGAGDGNGGDANGNDPGGTTAASTAADTAAQEAVAAAGLIPAGQEGAAEVPTSVAEGSPAPTGETAEPSSVAAAPTSSDTAQPPSEQTAADPMPADQIAPTEQSVLAQEPPAEATTVASLPLSANAATEAGLANSTAFFGEGGREGISEADVAAGMVPAGQPGAAEAPVSVAEGSPAPAGETPMASSQAQFDAPAQTTPEANDALGQMAETQRNEQAAAEAAQADAPLTGRESEVVASAKAAEGNPSLAEADGRFGPSWSEQKMAAADAEMQAIDSATGTGWGHVSTEDLVARGGDYRDSSEKGTMTSQEAEDYKALITELNNRGVDTGQDGPTKEDFNRNYDPETGLLITNPPSQYG